MNNTQLLFMFFFMIMVSNCKPNTTRKSFERKTASQCKESGEVWFPDQGMCFRAEVCNGKLIEAGSDSCDQNNSLDNTLEKEKPKNIDPSIDEEQNESNDTNIDKPQKEQADYRLNPSRSS